MNKITCDMCMDLMPLVKDGIASADSREAVESHLETCAVCRSLYHGQAPPVINTEKAFHKLKRQIQIFSAMLMLFGIFFGVNLTAGSNVFYNSLIMPIIGALGYMLLRWKALYTIPILLLITHGMSNLLGLIRGQEHLDIYSLLMWTALYSIFSLLGMVIAGLLSYAFRKEESV